MILAIYGSLTVGLTARSTNTQMGSGAPMILPR